MENVISKHKLHSKHRKNLLHSGAFNQFPGGFGGVLEFAALAGRWKMFILKQNGIRDIENAYFET